MSKQDETNTLAHTKWNCKYHVVFAPSSAVRTLGGFKSHAKQLIPLLEDIINGDEIESIKEDAKNLRKKLIYYREKHPEVLLQ